MSETWKDVVGFEGLYLVSNKGRVKSLRRSITKTNKWGSFSDFVYPERILKAAFRKGYRCVNLSFNGKTTDKRIARLVAEAFIPNPERLPEVNHKNGICFEDNEDNLEWLTHADNMRHSWQNLRSFDSYKKSIQARRYGEKTLVFSSIAEAARKGFCRTSIFSCLRGEQKRHKNYKWSYA